MPKLPLLTRLQNTLTTTTSSLNRLKRSSHYRKYVYATLRRTFAEPTPTIGALQMAGGVSTLAAYFSDDQLTLRLFFFGGTIAGTIIPNLYRRPRLFLPLAWGMAFLSINGSRIIDLLNARKPITFTTETLKIYESTYYRFLTPNQFSKLMAISDEVELKNQSGRLMKAEGLNSTDLILLLEGEIELRSLGEKVGSITVDEGINGRGGYKLLGIPRNLIWDADSVEKVDGDVEDDGDTSTSKSAEEGKPAAAPFTTETKPLALHAASPSLRYISTPLTLLSDLCKDDPLLMAGMLQLFHERLMLKVLVRDKKHCFQRYCAMVKIALHSPLTPEVRSSLKVFRDDHAITPAEHLDALTQSGWSLEEYDTGEHVDSESSGAADSWLMRKGLLHDHALPGGIEKKRGLAMVSSTLGGGSVASASKKVDNALEDAANSLAKTFDTLSYADTPPPPSLHKTNPMPNPLIQTPAIPPPLAAVNNDPPSLTAEIAQNRITHPEALTMSSAKPVSKKVVQISEDKPVSAPPPSSSGKLPQLAEHLKQIRLKRPHPSAAASSRNLNSPMASNNISNNQNSIGRMNNTFGSGGDEEKRNLKFFAKRVALRRRMMMKEELSKPPVTPPVAPPVTTTTYGDSIKFDKFDKTFSPTAKSRSSTMGSINEAQGAVKSKNLMSLFDPLNEEIDPPRSEPKLKSPLMSSLRKKVSISENNYNANKDHPERLRSKPSKPSFERSRSFKTDELGLGLGVVTRKARGRAKSF